MNTKYHEGLHILVNSKLSDRVCSVIKTSKSGHLVSAFTSTTSTNLVSLKGVVMSGSGILNTSFPLPDMTNNIQKDADLVAVDGTDKFISVWASNAEGSNYRIYMRSYTLGTSGQLLSESITIQVSQSNGDYVAPRVVYHSNPQIVLVMWISVVDKKAQLKAYKLNDDGTFTEASYQNDLEGTVSPEYFYATLDLHNSPQLSLSFLNLGDKALAVFKKDQNTLAFYSLEPAGGGVITQTHLIDYAATGIQSFSVDYDDSKSPSFKIVYVLGSTGDVYGDSVAYFPSVRGAQVRATPTVLNQANHSCSRPFIKRTPAINTDGERYFVVAWETTNAATFYNEFTSTYAQVSSEQEINQGDINTDKPRIVVTDNQIAIVVDAAKFGGAAMNGTGILYNVETRQSA